VIYISNVVLVSDTFEIRRETCTDISNKHGGRRETEVSICFFFFFVCLFLWPVVAGGTQKWLDGGLGRDEIEEIERSI